MGYVYLLTNAAMPGLVKIGKTDKDDVNERIRQLYTTAVPLPFELEYACRVDNFSEVESALHVAFGPQRININREYFSIDPEQAKVILKLLNRQDVTEELTENFSGINEVDLEAAKQARARRPNLNFTEMGIPINSILSFMPNPEITVTVIGPRTVRFGDEEAMLTTVTQGILKLSYAVRPTPYWSYNNRSLSEIYDETYS